MKRRKIMMSKRTKDEVVAEKSRVQRRRSSGGPGEVFGACVRWGSVSRLGRSGRVRVNGLSKTKENTSVRLAKPSG